MKYIIIGAGGTGGIIGYYMTKSGKDVTLIARNEHLNAIKRDGLSVKHLWDGSEEAVKVNACSMEEYHDQPDVILVCVKSYSLDSVIPFIKSVSQRAVVIPLLNIYTTGEKLQKSIEQTDVLDGCIYVSANITELGKLLQHGKILRIVFGRRDGSLDEKLKNIAADFNDSEIDGRLSQNIKRDALEKFSYVSPIGAAGLYYNACAGDFQKEGKERETLISMIDEIQQLAVAMNAPFEKDYVKVNLDILAHLAPESTTSMQRDVMAGHLSEIDGLVYEVVRTADMYGLAVPVYRKVSEELKKRGYK